MKACPFCAESIQDEAIKCRHCGEALNTTAAGWQTFRKSLDAMSPEQRRVALERLTSEQRKYLAYGGTQLSSQAAAVPTKSNLVAFLLGIFLGPVGLWYKRQWAAGFAWLAGALILGVATFGLIAPIMWLGMAIHAAVAEPRQ